MRRRRNILVPALVAVLVAGALVGALWLRDSTIRSRSGAGADNTLADRQPLQRQPDGRNGPGIVENTDKPSRNQPGNPNGNRPGNQAANTPPEPEQADELRLPAVPALTAVPAVPNPTPVLPELSWDPEAPFGVRTGEVITKPVLDLRYEIPGLPENTLGIWLRASDFAPGQTAHPVRVEIMNSTGRLLVDGIYRGGEESKSGSGDDPAFLLPYPEDDWFIIRLTKAGRVGIATFGTTPFTTFEDDSNLVQVQVGRGRKFRIALHVDIQDHLRARDAVRVLDRDGAPLAGAVLSRGHSILGRSGEDGVIRFAPPVQGELQQYVYDFWQRAVLRVSCPGKVPAFIKASDLKPDETLTVTLPSDEIVLSFYLLHTGFENAQRWEGKSLSRVDGRFGAIPYWAPWAGADGLEYVRKSNWRLSAWHQSSEPLNKVRPDGGKGPPGTYIEWYARKWSYEPSTGMWTVVVPHSGVFVYALKLERQYFTDNQGKPAQADLMSPGLHIDARDPANPKAQLIWPS